jgi:F-type H+-transporting ATPase subunit b
MFALLLGVVAVVLTTAPLLAAQGSAEAGGEANSPLYAPNQGLITGLATIIIFVLLVAILGKYAWGPILSGLRAREEKIRKDIADAEATRARAEATLREYNAQLATAEQKVRDMIAKATTDAEQALAEIYAQTAELSTRIAEKILKRNINADDQRELVNQSLQELEAVR